jgi:predicted Fe-Mo cluster-binding NifX family protein
LLIVDSETMQFEVISNTAAGSSGGAGIQAAQTIVNMGAKVLVTGNIGPNAFRALLVAGIQIMTGASGTVMEAIEKFKKGELKKTDAPTVVEHNSTKGQGQGIWSI